ncbi:hypothetical protein [Clostridium akagii]|nr:hypothetical protein [Clostridium akagii]
MTKSKKEKEKQNKGPSNNKGNSQSMNTLQTTASHKNPDPKT